MRNEEIKKHLNEVLKSNQQIDDKLDELIKQERHFKGKATFWGMIGGALISGGIWLIKYIIAKISVVV